MIDDFRLTIFDLRSEENIKNLKSLIGVLKSKK